MELLGIAAFAFFATHLGVSSTPLRGKLVNAMGEGPYRGVYSLVAVVTLGLMIYAYALVPHDNFLWYPTQALRLTAFGLMLLSAILLAMGLLSKNPHRGRHVFGGQTGPRRYFPDHPAPGAVGLPVVGHCSRAGQW